MEASARRQCRFFLQGGCRDGLNCKFSHETGVDKGRDSKGRGNKGASRVGNGRDDKCGRSSVSIRDSSQPRHPDPQGRGQGRQKGGHKGGRGRGRGNAPGKTPTRKEQKILERQAQLQQSALELAEHIESGRIDDAEV